MTGLKDKVQHLKALYRDRNLAADGKVLLTHETVYSFRLFQSCLQFDGEVRGNGRGDGIPSPKSGTVV